MTPLLPKNCESCGTVFTPKTTWQRFCKTQCKFDWHAGKAERLGYELRKEIRELREKLEASKRKEGERE